MRIGMILDKTFPPDPRVKNEAAALINDGKEVYLFCLNYKSEKPTHEEIDGISICRYTSNNIEYKLSALVFTLPFYTYLMKRKIYSFLIENKIEAIHIHDIRIAEAVFHANKKLNLPTILDLHDNMPEIIKLYPHLQKFPGKQLISPKKWKEKEEDFIHMATKVITVSNEFIEEVRERTRIKENKISLVPNTVSTSFYKNSYRDNNIFQKFKNKFVILYLGDTGLRRGLLTAIDAVPELKKIIPNLMLVIVGKNSEDQILKRRVEELNIGNFVNFEGWQDMDLFPTYIETSAVCISPLHRNIQHDVAYANKLFQYMSLSKPVLVSNALAQKKLILRTESGLVHEEKNAADFAKKVLQLYDDPELRKRLGSNGSKFIKDEFVWEKVSKNLTDVYNDLN